MEPNRHQAAFRQVLGRLARPIRHDRLILLLLLSCLGLMTKLLVVLYDPPPAAASAPAAAPAADLLHSAPPASRGDGAVRRRREATDPESGTRTVYVITATYPRPGQEAELVRLSQTLMHAAPFLLWVLVEDASRRTPAVAELLRRSGLRHVHLLGEGTRRGGRARWEPP